MKRHEIRSHVTECDQMWWKDMRSDHMWSNVTRCDENFWVCRDAPSNVMRCDQILSCLINSWQNVRISMFDKFQVATHLFAALRSWQVSAKGRGHARRMGNSITNNHKSRIRPWDLSKSIDLVFLIRNHCLTSSEDLVVSMLNQFTVCY